MSAMQPEQLYEADFYAWTQAQAKELRRFAKTRPNVPLDLAHIAEEIQDLGKSEYEAVFSLTPKSCSTFCSSSIHPRRISGSIGSTRSTRFVIRLAASSRRPSGVG
jgi:hypothetical protein